MHVSEITKAKADEFTAKSVSCGLLRIAKADKL